MHHDEIRLVLEALGGNADAFGSLTDRYSRLILGLAYSYVGDFQAAQDIAQESFVKAWLSLGTLHRPDRFASWLRQITANLARDHLRRQARRETVPLEAWDQASEEDSAMERGLLREELLKHLQAVPEGPRTAMVLHYLMGLSPADAAAHLAISRAAFDTRLSRGREALRRELTQLMDDALTTKQAEAQSYLNGLTARVRAALDAGPKERITAARELALLAARANLDRLSLDLTNPNGAARQKAAQLMAETGDRRAIPPLLGLLATEEEPTVQAELCRSLARLGATEAVAPLQHLARQTADMVVHKAATEAVRALEAPDPNPVDGDIAVSVGDLREAGLEELLLAMLRDPSPQVRAHAADGLGRVESVKALPGLIELLAQDPQEFVRLTAAEALGAVAGRRRQSPDKITLARKSRVIEALTRALVDSYHGTVAEAARSLTLIDLTEPQRTAVVDALFADVLPELLKRKPGAWWATLPFLFGHVGREPEMLRLAQIRLENLYPMHNGPLNNALDQMAGPGRTSANEVILEVLKGEVRNPFCLIRALGKTQDPAVSATVAAYLAPGAKHPPNIWAAAAGALAQLPDGAARLQAVVESGLAHGKPEEGPLLAAMEALEGVGGPEVAQWLEAVAERLPPRVRIRAQAASRRLSF